ncbi:MAG: hypothetical protein WC623_24040 [Pedobacter sp.]|uniref:hypothetical protein n=1 Tax=Pedobacter sp. TaxID=1411316 RepID=UPI0035698668
MQNKNDLDVKDNGNSSGHVVAIIPLYVFAIFLIIFMIIEKNKTTEQIIRFEKAVVEENNRFMEAVVETVKNQGGE